MTLTEALYRHVSGVALLAKTYSVYGPVPATTEDAAADVVVITFDGASFTSMTDSGAKDARFTLICVSRQHLQCAELTELLANSLHGFSGVMGGTGGVDVIDIQAEEQSEDFDGEHNVFTRSISLVISYEP